MIKNKKITKAFDEKFDKKAMRRSITRSQKNKMDFNYFLLIPISLLLFTIFVEKLSGRISMKTESSKECSIASMGMSQNIKDETAKNNIVYNDPGPKGTNGFQKYESNDYSGLSNDLWDTLIVPYYLTRKEYDVYSYKKDMGHCEVTGHHIELSYKEEEGNRKIVVSYSPHNWPVRTYTFNNETTEDSTFNGYKVQLYKKDNTLFARFTFENNYYEIEGKNIDETTFFVTLSSILK